MAWEGDIVSLVEIFYIISFDSSVFYSKSQALQMLLAFYFRFVQAQVQHALSVFLVYFTARSGTCLSDKL